MKMKEIIQSLWIGRSLSLIEHLCITSFQQHGYDFHLYCYDEIGNIPAGTTIKDAADILPASEIFYYQNGEGKGSVAAFSNLFRYKLLWEQGGWWVDLDLVCLKPFDFAEPVVIASERCPTFTQATNAVMRLPPKHKVAHLCYQAARQADRSNLIWGSIGPELLNRAAQNAGLKDFVKPPDVFCPVDYWQWHRVLEKPNPSESLYTSESHAIHLWHEQWRRAGFGVNPTTGEINSINLVRKLWRYLRQRPAPGINPSSLFVELLHRYGCDSSA